MAERVYVETSIIGHLTMRRSTQIVVAARQELTRRWWSERRSSFGLVTSQVVIDEIATGDATAAAERMAVVRDIPVLDVTEATEALARRLVSAGPLPPKAVADAAHIAVAAVHGVDFLLTWNCTHIANAVLRSPIERIVRAAGLRPPILCTPEELLDA